MVITLTWLECGYRNGSDRMVIVRCVGPEEFFLERVVFPFELLSFACPPDSEVKIWTHGLGGPELLETIPVEELVNPPGSSCELAATLLASPDPTPIQRPTPAPEPPTALHSRDGLAAAGGGDLVEAWVTAV